jgi:hypothetical protein
LRLHVADLHGAVGKAQGGRLHARAAEVVRHRNVRTVVDEALDEVFFRAAHQRRYGEEERDAEHDAGERYERLPLAVREVCERDVEP